MKITYRSVLLLGLVILAILFFNRSNEPVVDSGPEKLKSVWYGSPSKISLSGDFRFDSTDQNGDRIKDGHWFWALPRDLQDTENIDRIFTMLSENPKGTYKLTGVRDEDDCNYYEAGPLVGTCVQSIIIDNISLIKP